MCEKNLEGKVLSPPSNDDTDEASNDDIEEETIVDDNIDVGDLVLLRGDVPHGVEKIDPNKEFELLSSGRWMGLFAINKLQGSNKIENSKTIETA